MKLLYIFIFATSSYFSPANASGALAADEYQDRVFIEFFLPTIHAQKQPLGPRYSYKLDDDGIAVWLPGVSVGFDKATNGSFLKTSHIRSVTSYNRDCLDQPTFLFHIGLRWELVRSGSFTLDVGGGPVYWMRHSWEKFSFYTKGQLGHSALFPEYESMWLFFGDFGLAWRIDEHLSFIYNIIPAIPFVVGQSGGVSWSL